MKSPWPLMVFFCFSSFVAFSQKQLKTRVSFNYRDVSLGYALDDLGKRYDISFSYSKDFIPLDKEVNAKANKEPLSNGLDILLTNTKVVYTSIGSYIVLRSDPNKEIEPEQKQLGKIREKLQETARPIVDSPIFTTSIEPDVFEVPEPRPKRLEPAGSIEQLRLESLDAEFTSEEILQSLNDIQIIEKEFPGKSGLDFKAQLSLIPNLGTNLGKSKSKTNNVSINLISGKNGGVDGLEIGALYNGIEKDVKGAQISGLVNKVKGDVDGVQIAGLVNVTKGNLQGGQISAISNKVHGNANGFQIAGLSNKSKLNAGVQIAGLSNKAGDVEKIQIAALYNKAAKVKGFQIGLINVSDTIEGAAIGLLNFTKRGYNRIELSTGELIHYNMNIKFGGHHFYNIFQFGKIASRNNRPSGWTLGYGIGSSWRTGKKSRSNIEVIGSHVNEGQWWTNNLNLLGQVKITQSWVIKKKFELFFGPVLNMFVSNIYNSETGELGSQVVPYSILDFDVEKDLVSVKGLPQDIRIVNYKFWLGFSTGIRF